MEKREIFKAIDLLYQEQIISWYQWGTLMKKAKNLKVKGNKE